MSSFPRFDGEAALLGKWKRKFNGSDYLGFRVSQNQGYLLGGTYNKDHLSYSGVYMGVPRFGKSPDLTMLTFLINHPNTHPSC